MVSGLNNSAVFTPCCRNETGSEKCDGTGETSRKGDWLLCFLILLEGLLTQQVIWIYQCIIRDTNKTNRFTLKVIVSYKSYS